MDDITIGVTENVNNISVTAQPNDQIIDIAVTETVETVLLDVSTTVQEVSVTATQNVIVENITVDYVSNENHIDINVTDASQDVTLNVTPTLIEINILRSGGEVNILQFDSLADFPTTGSSDYFYLAKDTNKLYRWTGSAYAEISATANAVWGQIIGTLSEQTDLQNALNLKAPINSPTFTGTVSGITKGMVGLGAVDNTSDLDKPISTATQTALNAKQPLDADLTSIAALSGTYGLLKKTNENSYTIDTNTYLTEITSSDVTDALGFTPENAANKGIANGYASLNGDGKVPSSQLPSYVDDVIEVANYGSLPATGETGKIYITLDTNKIYRWTGSVYVEVSSSAAVWGAITGTLSNQTDLQNALDAKLNVSTAASTYYLASNPNGYTSNTGTVTSVAMTVPSAFSVSGSPITNSGTLAITATGNTTQYIAGDGSLVTFPTIGTAGTLIREVRNTTGATLTKGTVVYISGATGNKPTVSKAIAVGDSTSAQTFGLVQADIANNANGNVVCAGDLTGIDTSTLTEGAQLYLSSATAGAYTTTKQYAPAHLVYIGIVTRAHPTLGQIEVNIQNGYELDELHNVAAQTPSNNDGLFYETSTSLWKNKSIATVLGYTPANGADYMALSGNQSIAGQKTFTGYGLFENGIYIKQDGTLSGIAGYNLIDANTTSIIMALPDLVGAAHFDLSGLTTFRYYNLPNASGTFALLSDIPSLAGYVATTGNQSIAGIKTFTTQLHANVLKFSESGGFNQTAGFTQIGGTADYFAFANGTNAKSAQFTYGTGTAFNLPDSNGTLALTSQLHNAVTIGTANGLSLSTQVLSLGLASSSTNGALSSTDWNTFNGKQNALTNPVTGTGTTSYLPKFTGTSAIGNSLLYDTGSVLLVGATSASDGQSKLELVSAGTVGLKIISSAVNGNNTFLSIQANKEWRFLTNRGDLISGNQGDLIIRNNTDGINHIILSQAGTTSFSGDVSIGNASPIFPATGRGNLTINGSSTSILTLGLGGTFSSYLYSDSSRVELSTNAQPLAIVTNSAERMRITAAGNVGIGTSTPGALLHISNASSATFIRVESTSTGTAGSFDMYVSGTGGFNAGTVGFNANGSVPMTFNVASVERMRITPDGRVGIGTTAASETLHIAKNGTSDYSAALWTNTNSTANLYVGVGGSAVLNTPLRNNAYIMNAAASGLALGTSDAVRMFITSDGNVGIGTTSPSSTLSVQAPSNTTSNMDFFSGNNIKGHLGMFANNFYITSNWFYNGSQNADSLSFGQAAITFDTSTANGSINFATSVAGSTAPPERMRITSAGSVLVNSTSSLNSVFKFQVGDGSTDSRALFNPNNPYAISVRNGASSLWYIGVDTATATNGLQFYANELGAAAMTIRTNGNVGIGTTSPGAKLDVNGTIYASGTGGFASATYVVNARNPIWRFGNADAYGLSYFQAAAGYSNLDVIGLHFGTATSSASQFQFIQNGNYIFSGSPISDIRAKENINNLSFNATEKVMALQSKSYYMKNGNNKLKYGFIAQEVYEILPDLISGDLQNDSIVGLDYNGVLAVAVKAIQELKAELDTLKNK